MDCSVKCFHNRVIRQQLLSAIARTKQQQASFLVSHRKIVQQAGFPDPRFARNQNHAAAGSGRAVEIVFQAEQGRGTPDQRDIQA